MVDVFYPPGGASSAVDVTDRALRELGLVGPTAGAVWDVSDRAARLLGRVSADAGAVWDVSDRAGRLLGQVAPAAGALWDVSDRGARAVGLVGPAAASVWDVSDRAARAVGQVSPAAGAVWQSQPATLAVSVAGGANAIATLTLPAPGAGLFIYLTYLHVRRVATAALAGGALLTVTSTNLPGTPSWRTGNQASITVSTFDGPVLVDQAFPFPLKATAVNTAVTIVGPAAGAAVSWHITAHYFTAA
jgi:hypothetical protein